METSTNGAVMWTVVTFPVLLRFYEK